MPEAITLQHPQIGEEIPGIPVDHDKMRSMAGQLGECPMRALVGEEAFQRLRQQISPTNSAEREPTARELMKARAAAAQASQTIPLPPKRVSTKSATKVAEATTQQMPDSELQPHPKRLADQLIPVIQPASRQPDTVITQVEIDQPLPPKTVIQQRSLTLEKPAVIQPPIRLVGLVRPVILREPLVAPTAQLRPSTTLEVPVRPTVESVAPIAAPTELERIHVEPSPERHVHISAETLRTSPETVLPVINDEIVIQAANKSEDDIAVTFTSEETEALNRELSVKTDETNFVESPMYEPVSLSEIPEVEPIDLAEDIEVEHELAREQQATLSIGECQPAAIEPLTSVELSPLVPPTTSDMATERVDEAADTEAIVQPVQQPPLSIMMENLPSRTDQALIPAPVAEIDGAQAAEEDLEDDRTTFTNTAHQETAAAETTRLILPTAAIVSEVSINGEVSIDYLNRLGTSEYKPTPSSVLLGRILQIIQSAFAGHSLLGKSALSSADCQPAPILV